MSDLGDRLGISHVASSHLLDRLVHQGLASRSEDPHDRRLKHIILTAKGRRVLHDSLRAQQSWLEDVAGRLTPGERKQVLKALKPSSKKPSNLSQRSTRTADPPCILLLMIEIGGTDCQQSK